MTTTDRTTATDAEFVARFAPFDPALAAPVGVSASEQLAEALVGHRYDSVGMVCSCGQECGVVCDGLTREQHLADVLTPLVEQIATERAASELEAAAGAWIRHAARSPIRLMASDATVWLRDRAAVLRSQSRTDSKGDQS